MNKTVICPGSFDPVTLGHLDIITRASGMFDKVIVAVLVNSGKTPTFTTEERIQLLNDAVSGLPNVEIVSFKGLLAEYCKQSGIDTIVKGLRAVSDFEYEFQMAIANKKLNPNLETIRRFRFDLPQLQHGARDRLYGRRHKQFRSCLRSRQDR